jgi:hypothetical protein
MVTDETSDMALPFNTVCTNALVLFAGDDSVTPELAMIVPVITPPPA